MGQRQANPFHRCLATEPAGAKFEESWSGTTALAAYFPPVRTGNWTVSVGLALGCMLLLISVSFLSGKIRGFKKVEQSTHLWGTNQLLIAGR